MSIKILHLSDTHGQHSQLTALPEADVIIHSGDVAYAGSEAEIMDFMEWFLALPYRYRIFVAGNHDNELFEAEVEGLPEGCYYLNNSGVWLEGLAERAIYVYGVPLFLEDTLCGRQCEYYRAIPEGIDVLVTHQPPYGVLDQSGSVCYGDKDLLLRVMELAPKLHLFGHIHDAWGQVELNGTIYSNAAVVDEAYALTHRPLVYQLDL